MRQLKTYLILTLLLLVIGASLQAITKYPLTLQDQLKQKVTLAHQPNRIISTAPSNTEILFALGLEKKLVGVTNWCNYPPAAQKLEKIGDLNPLNIEKILALRPELILANKLNDQAGVNRLIELGITVCVLDPQSFTEIIESIKIIGKLNNRESAAQKLIGKLQKTISQTKQQGSQIKKAKLQVYLQLDGTSAWTAGPGSFLDEAITLAGGTNIARDLGKPWGELSLETVLARNPDVIITSVDPTKLYQDPAWSKVAAIQKHQVFQIEMDTYYRPGPRLIEMLPEMAAIFKKCK